MNKIIDDAFNNIPPLYATEKDDNPMVWVKIFFPDFHWTWYIIEFDGTDRCFGFVDGDFPELGYFRLSELEQIRGRRGLSLERDKWFRPGPLSEVRRYLRR